VADTTKWAPTTWPATAQGWGPTEAPRGALGHWVSIADGKITKYQMVVPSTWNGSPRDAAGRRGPWEEALVGTPLLDPARPVEVLRTVHSFDPCMACAVHVHRPGGGVEVTVEA
jgi:Ni,Fe-hydrogenase I large subunit